MFPIRRSRPLSRACGTPDSGRGFPDSRLALLRNPRLMQHALRFTEAPAEPPMLESSRPAVRAEILDRRRRVVAVGVRDPRARNQMLPAVADALDRAAVEIKAATDRGEAEPVPVQAPDLAVAIRIHPSPGATASAAPYCLDGGEVLIGPVGGPELEFRPVRLDDQRRVNPLGEGGSGRKLCGRTVIGVIREGPLYAKCLKSLVGVSGFEPPAPASRRQCSTRLSYTPNPSGRPL